MTCAMFKQFSEFGICHVFNMLSMLSALAQDDHPRIMEVDEDSENLDLGGKSLDQSSDEVTDFQLLDILKRIEKTLSSQDLKSKMMSSRRLQEFSHLVETERNYVNILMNIMKVSRGCCYSISEVHLLQFIAKFTIHLFIFAFF
jgi:hypothetical protein